MAEKKKLLACATKYSSKFCKKVLLPHSFSKASNQTTEENISFKNQQIEGQITKNFLFLFF